MFIVVDLIWDVITSINSLRTILLSLELLSLIKFRLQPFFFEIKLTSVGNNIKKNQKKII